MSKKPPVKTKLTVPLSERVTLFRAEAAALIGVDIQTIDGWISSGVLRASNPSKKLGKRGRVLIRRASVDAMLDANPA
jgi:Helix-turn-helix domain